MPTIKKPPPNLQQANAWDQQPWETDLAYMAFFKHYLMQEPPRRITTAYTTFAAERGFSPRVNKHGHVSPPDNFRRWAYGVDSHNARPEGSLYENALTWEERAAAYDKMILKELEDQWRARQQGIRLQEWEAGDALMQRAQKMLDRFDVDATQWTDDTIARHVEIGMKLKRRAAGMPERTETPGQWRVEVKKLGIDPNEVLELIAGIIAEDAGGETDPDADSQAA